jgi:adenosylhomocysteine nucleosidase
VAQAAQQQFASQVATGDASFACDVAVVFAMGEESGGLEDLLEDTVRTQGHGFTLRHGLLHDRHVTIAISGAGAKAAAAAAEAVLLTHRPQWLISAGFCGGLVSTLAKHDLVLGDRVLCCEGGKPASGDAAQGGRPPIEIAWPSIAAEWVQPSRGIHRGTLVTSSGVMLSPADKRALGEKTGAAAVDMESYAVMEICRARHVPHLAIRIVSDAVDEQMPREVETLVRQKSRAGQLGAAFGALLNRPGSIKDLYKLKENAILATVRLGKFLARVIERIVPEPPNRGSY